MVYPIFQLDGRRTLPGRGLVLAALDGVLQPLTIASWLTRATLGRCGLTITRSDPSLPIVRLEDTGLL